MTEPNAEAVIKAAQAREAAKPKPAAKANADPVPDPVPVAEPVAAADPVPDPVPVVAPTKPTLRQSARVAAGEVVDDDPRVTDLVRERGMTLPEARKLVADLQRMW